MRIVLLEIKDGKICRLDKGGEVIATPVGPPIVMRVEPAFCRWKSIKEALEEMPKEAFPREADACVAGKSLTENLPAFTYIAAIQPYKIISQ
jgi:hypothetical protein